MVPAAPRRWHNEKKKFDSVSGSCCVRDPVRCFSCSDYPNEYKMIRQFGEIVRVVETPGVSFKIPFLQTGTSIPRALQIYDIPQSDVITKDKRTMIADAFVAVGDFRPRAVYKTFKRSGSAGPVQNFGFCLLIDEVGHLQYGSG